MKINNCPWCGSKPKLIVTQSGRAWVCCNKCGMNGPGSTVKVGAVLAWNSLGTEKQWAEKTVRSVHRKLSRAAGESMGGEA